MIDFPKSETSTASSKIARVDGGSNVIIVECLFSLHNVKQTSNKEGRTRGGAAKTTHAGDLHMLLETDSKKALLIMK